MVVKQGLSVFWLQS